MQVLETQEPTLMGLTTQLDDNEPGQRIRHEKGERRKEGSAATDVIPCEKREPQSPLHLPTISRHVFNLK